MLVFSFDLFTIVGLFIFDFEEKAVWSSVSLV